MGKSSNENKESGNKAYSGSESESVNRGRCDHEKDSGGIRKSTIFGQDYFNRKSKAVRKMLNIQKIDDGVIFEVKVQPGAAKNDIVGVQGDALRVRINAPPVKGKANRALIDFLADELGVKRSEVEIMSGHTSNIKKIKVLGEGVKIEKNLQHFLS